MRPRLRIAVLFHANDRHYDPSRYVVHYLTECWRADGHEVVYLFGVRKFVPADILLVHVNLTVVPDAYLEFAARYPISLNSRVRDIRKSVISRNLVGTDDDWDGPVIVKSDLNDSGYPERLLRRIWIERRWPLARTVRRRIERLRGRTPPFERAADYAVFKHRDAVPGRWLENPLTVVEKFWPEVENGLYHIRQYQFLGNRWSCTRVGSKRPIVKVQADVRRESIDPPPAVEVWRQELGLDYGKIDYVVNDGNVVLLDANKTTGAAPYSSMSPDVRKQKERLRRNQAEGLYGFLTT